MPSQSQASTLVNRGGRSSTGTPGSSGLVRRRAGELTNHINQQELPGDRFQIAAFNCLHMPLLLQLASARGQVAPGRRRP